MSAVRPFELAWLGGAAERGFRRVRPLDDFPWGTLDPNAYPPELVVRARRAWTVGAHTEYCTAAAFAEIQSALLATSAPVDLIGMAGSFVADEMLHTELNARMAMELGGAAPVRADFEALSPPLTPGLTARERANELIVRTCCVGEAFSVPILSGTLVAASSHPLTQAVLRRIAKDEGPHAQLGWLYLDWVGDSLSAGERERLGRVAAEAVRDYLPDWQGFDPRPAEGGRTPEGYRVGDVGALGWMTSSRYRAVAERTLREAIARPLARYGILLDA